MMSRRRSLTSRDRLLETESDASLGQVVGRHLDVDAIASQNADAVLAHLARRMGEDFVLVVQLHPEHGVGQQLRDGSGKLDHVFFGHSPSLNGSLKAPQNANPTAPGQAYFGPFLC